MGSSMQRQSLSLYKKETAIVGTGTEKIIANTSHINICYYKSALIKYKSKEMIITHEQILNKIINSKSTKSFFKKIKCLPSFKINYKKYIRRNYKTNLYSNKIKNSITNWVKKNKWGKKGINLIEENTIKNSTSALGTNLLVAYMIWKGYNFEDAVIINERLVKNDKLTSIQIKKYKTFLINDQTGKVRKK